MKKVIRYVGLDVHGETVAVAIAEGDRRAESLTTIPNKPNCIAKLVKQLGEPKHLRVCYEAGPCGYVIYWQLTKLGIHCDVVAPTLIPLKAGDKVKTDKRDAQKLASLYRSGELTPVWVPDQAHEALRDLVRGREAANRDYLRVRQRLSKFLLRQGRRRPEDVRAWGNKHEKWLKKLQFEHASHTALFEDLLAEVDHQRERMRRLDEKIDVAVANAPEAMRKVVAALQALRGVAKVTAVTVVAEVGNLSRFDRPAKLMGYAGIVPSEHSSGGRTKRGRLTKTGNGHLRRVIVEAAWHYRHRPCLGVQLKKRQREVDPQICETAWKAQNRLNKRYCSLAARGKPAQQVIAAVARELLGFIWSVGTQQEAKNAA